MQHPTYYLLSCLFIVSFSLHAAKAVSLANFPLDKLKQTFQLIVPGSAQMRGKNDSLDSLQWINQHRDERNTIHLRMQQTYAGFPVFGGYAILHAPYNAAMTWQNSSAVHMSGTVYQMISNELGQPKSLFIKRAALALDNVKAAYLNETILEESVLPLVYIDANHRAFWAYKVSLFVQSKQSIPKRPTVILDANTFHVFEQWDDIKTSVSEVEGLGYGGNRRVGVYQYGADYPALQLMRDNETNTGYMENKDVAVIDMHHTYNRNLTTMVFACKTDTNACWTGYKADGFDEMNGAYSPANDSLYFGLVVKDMYKTWYGVDVLTFENKPMKLIMRVHYGQQYTNAFWDGKQASFGDGDNSFYPLVSLGISAHEISHGFTEQHSGLVYYGQSGGMNESFSDMAAQAAESYLTKKNSWSIGQEVIKEGGAYDAFRYMDEPTRDGVSIDRAYQYRIGMDVHQLSGVYNRLFYLLAHQPGWDVRQAFHVMLKANMYYWTPWSNFAQGACGVLNAANDLGLSLEAVKLSLKDVGIDYAACSE